MKILFWNLGKNDNYKPLVECVKKEAIDIVILCEHSNFSTDSFLDALPNFREGKHFMGKYRTQILFSERYDVKIIKEQGSYSVYTVMKDDEEYIIVGVHLPDRKNYEPGTRKNELKEVVKDVKDQERKDNCDKTIVIGDFNANAFDDELVSLYSIDAVLYKDVINSRETREYLGKTYKRFYNPTIDYLSEKKEQYGSYYYSGGERDIIWFSLDQAIVRKSLVNRIEEYRYIKKIGKVNLLSADKIPLKEISDHLPLLVEIGD